MTSCPARIAVPTSSWSRPGSTGATIATACPTSSSKRWPAAGRSWPVTSARSAPRSSTARRGSPSHPTIPTAWPPPSIASTPTAPCAAASGTTPAWRRSPSTTSSPASSGSSMPSAPRTETGAMAERAIAYVLKGYPRRSELFIASEIWRLEQLGVRLHLIVLTPPEEVERHAVVDAVRAAPWHLPAMTSLSATTARAWLRANLSSYLPALRRVAARHPLRLAGVAASAAAQAIRARDGWRPRKVFLKELLQAVAVADRVDALGDVAHLHAHFAHGSTTVTWWAARLAGRSFSFTGHAKDLYRPSLNPAGLLARKLRAAAFAVTCTGANVDHLRSLATTRPVHLVYHGLNPDFARLVETGPRVAAPARFRIVSVGRMVDKKGFDVLIDAVALLRDGGIDAELVLAGEDGPA